MNGDGYQLTEFGNQLVKHRGSIGLIFGGYRHILANQEKYACDESHLVKKNIDYKAIARASIFFGDEAIDPIVIEVIKKLGIAGTICDLGCGACSRLVKLCALTNSSGLGIELASDAIKEAKKNIQFVENVTIEQGDITRIERVYPEVELLMQFFVMHDIAAASECQEMMDSYLDNFPNLKYFIYTDVVSPSNSLNTQLAGFDYVHSLLGIKPRNYEETMKMFEHSQYSVVEEISILGRPNTFMWILSPR